MSETKFTFRKFSWYSNWEDVGYFHSGFDRYYVQVRVNRKGKRKFRNERVNKGSTCINWYDEIKEINHG